MGDPFRRVALGRTALQVTQFGLGSAQLGWMYEPVSRQQALDTVRRAHELGCGFFDTSPLYGSGLAETRFGSVLPALPRDSFTLSDKVGYAIYPESPLPDEASAQPPPAPGRDYSYDGTLRMVEGSLLRLGLDRIDVLLVHDPDDHMDQALAGSYRALRRLRDEGVVGAIGAGMNDSHLLARLAREGDFDCFLMAGRYTLLDQTALADLLPLAQERGIAIYIGGPFNSGILANPFAPNATFNYNKAAGPWVERAQRLDGVCRRHGVSLKAAAIQFPLGHPAVVSVLSGARSVAELEENVAAFREELPVALWDDLRAEGLLGEEVPVPSGL
jgi:D-threo-aldose 1-dehydrogenase